MQRRLGGFQVAVLVLRERAFERVQEARALKRGEDHPGGDAGVRIKAGDEIEEELCLRMPQQHGVRVDAAVHVFGELVVVVDFLDGRAILRRGRRRGELAELTLVRLYILLKRGDEFVHRLRRDDDAGADLVRAHMTEHEVDDEFFRAVLDDLAGGVNSARDFFIINKYSYAIIINSIASRFSGSIKSSPSSFSSFSIR